MTATLHPFPVRQPSRHARGEGIRNARLFNLTTMLLASEVVTEHVLEEWALEFPAMFNWPPADMPRDDRERNEQVW